MSRNYDVVVIGAGPAGYIAAIRAAQHGMSVACIDEWKNRDGKNAFGGTCLNAGCIPSKALLESSEVFEQTSNHAGDHGVVVGNIGLDLEAMMTRKARIVGELTGGVAGLMKKNKVAVFAGTGRLTAADKVVVDGAEGTTEIEAAHVCLAMGSASIDLPFLPVDGDRVVSSTEALSFEAVPSSVAR